MTNLNLYFFSLFFLARAPFPNSLSLPFPQNCHFGQVSIQLITDTVCESESQHSFLHGPLSSQGEEASLESYLNVNKTRFFDRFHLQTVLQNCISASLEFVAKAS